MEKPKYRRQRNSQHIHTEARISILVSFGDSFFSCERKFDRCGTQCYVFCMKDLMTRRFFKWVSTQPVSKAELETGLSDAQFEKAIANGDFKEV